MADSTCQICSEHVGCAKSITALQEQVKFTRELLDFQIKGIEYDRITAKGEMERRLEGMNGLEARANARIVEAETRARETTNRAEQKLADQAKEFIKNVEFKAEIKLLDTKLDSLAEAISEKKGEYKWSSHIVTVLLAAGIMLLIHFLFKF